MNARIDQDKQQKEDHELNTKTSICTCNGTRCWNGPSRRSGNDMQIPEPFEHQEKTVTHERQEQAKAQHTRYIAQQR